MAQPFYDMAGLSMRVELSQIPMIESGLEKHLLDTLATMSTRIRRPITHREYVIAGLFAVAWTLAWVATGVALSMAR